MGSYCVEISTLMSRDASSQMMARGNETELNDTEFAMLTAVAINALFPEQNRQWSEPLVKILSNKGFTRDHPEYEPAFDRMLHSVGVQQFLIVDNLKKITPDAVRADVNDDRSLILHTL